MAAAMKAKLASMITAIETKGQWDEIIENLNGRLLFIDVHKKWSGPCTVMRPTLEKIFLDIENVEARLQFVSLHEESGVDHPGLQEFLQAKSCKPRFVILLNENIVANIDGALSPSVTAAIIENLPEME
jgi:hypothetical protein